MVVNFSLFMVYYVLYLAVVQVIFRVSLDQLAVDVLSFGVAVIFDQVST
jgi:hypothetical protein